MVYGYARVSTYKQSLSNSLEEQKEMQRKSKLLDDKLSQADELIAKLNAQLERKEQ